jgi:GNAT superfamily N-acetyltransferase
LAVAAELIAELDECVASSLRFSSDPAELDLDLVFQWLSEDAYWAIGRSRATHDAAITGSRNYGVFDGDTGAQLGFARIITDGATFAWLCDVYVTPDARGRGAGQLLLTGILAELDPLGLKRISLRTLDAHSLYEKFGFQVLDEPEKWMDRRAPAGVR